MASPAPSSRDFRPDGRTAMANLEINVARFLRVSLGAGYRVALASNANELSSSQISGFVVAGVRPPLIRPS